MHIRVIDFETTGMPPEASVCEAAFVDLSGEPLQIASQWCSFVRPTTAMNLEALAVHHITAEECASGSAWEEASAVLMDGGPIFAAHNAAFEQAFFNPEGSVWIDTWKVALRLWQDCPSHSNQVLRYFLGLTLGAEAMPPHRALPDAWVTAHILLRALQVASVQDMVQWTQEPAYLTRITFGKHRGKLFSEAPRDYLEWCLRQDMEPGVIAACKRALAAPR